MTIPRYGEQRVAVEPLPTVRTPTNVPIDAIRPLPHIDISGVVKAADEYYQNEKQKADQISVLGAESKAAALESKVLYDPQTGVLNLKGKDALQARDRLQQSWQQGMSEIGKDLHNDTQRMAFDRSAQARFATMQETVGRHIANEVDKYDTDQTQSFVANETNAAVATAIRGAPLSSVADRSTLAISRQLGAVRDLAQRQGYSKEQTDELMATTRSQTHAAVIQKLLANGDDQTAQRYYQTFGDELVGKDAVTAEKAVQVSSTKAASQRQTLDILKSSPTLADAMKQVDAIQDPNIQDETRERVRRGFEDQQASDRLQREQAQAQATKIVNETNDFDKVPVEIANLLDDDQKTSLRRLAFDNRFPQVRTDVSLYTHLNNLAALPSTREQFLNMHFEDPKFRSQLSETDIKHFSNLQRQLRTADERKDTAADKKTQAAEAALHRKEEATVIKQGEAADKAKRQAELLEKTSKGASKYLPPPPKVHVPKWMVDSAATDPEYADYLRMHGVTVPTAAPAPVAGDKTPSRARAPGAPIVPPQPTGNVDLRKPEDQP